jgi:hypothetical protein
MDRRSIAETTDRSHTKSERGWLLYHGIKNLIRCDAAETVSGIARFVISQHDKLREGAEWVDQHRGSPIPPAIAVIGGLKSLLQVRSGRRSDGAVWIARRSNERHALEGLPSLLPELEWIELKFRWRPEVRAFFALCRSIGRPWGRPWRRIFNIARLLHQRYEFFKVLRVGELIGYYMRYLHIFRSGRFDLAVTSNHSNAHGIAFNIAARKCGVPVVLITHGMPVRPVARLSYDLAVVHCEAARQIYLQEGCRMDRVLIHGRRQDYAPMPGGILPEQLTVGIFLCKDVNEKRLCALIERLLDDRRVSTIIVRPHPTNLWMGLDDWITERHDPRVRRSSSGSVSHDVEAVDIVLAGNSSVLVEAVTAGRPSGYVSDLDYGSPDLHEFVARDLIYPIGDELNFDPEAMLRFYLRPDWPTALRLFANIDEDETSVAMHLANALRELAATHKLPAEAGTQN